MTAIRLTRGAAAVTMLAYAFGGSNPSPTTISLKGARFLNRFGQPLKIFFARNGDPAQARGNRSQHLDIEERKSTLAQVLVQIVQNDFGSVADPVKHGFASEEPADA